MRERMGMGIGLALGGSLVLVVTLMYTAAALSAGAWRPWTTTPNEVQWDEVAKIALPAAALIVATVGAVIAAYGHQARLEELALSRDSDVTDRYTKAVEQLGNETQLAVRLGGIYALERIHHDSERDRASIANLLGTFVTANAVAHSDEPGEEPTIPHLPPSADVVAAIQALGRLATPHVRLGSLSLVGIDLAAAELPNCYANSVMLHRANLRGAQLESALLRKANLSHTNLIGVNLANALLSSANLNNAILPSANLSEANLNGAQLNEANMSNAIVTRARLTNAWLTDATLNGADFRHADLTRARLMDSRIMDSNFASARLWGADLTSANLTGTDLTGADLGRAKLIGADLSGVNFTDAHLDSADLTGAIFSDSTNLHGVRWESHRPPITDWAPLQRKINSAPRPPTSQ